MNESDRKLDRLLRSAVGGEEAPVSMPFGFDTRVVALWRETCDRDAWFGLARAVRYVALAATAVIILSAAGTYREIKRTDEQSEPFANEFAIADTAIQDEFLQ